MSNGHSPQRFGDVGRLYAEHADRVLVYLARRCLDPEVAVDLLAETFAEAYEHRRTFRGSSEEEAAGWLFGIARHQLSTFFRRGRAEQKAVRRLGIQLPPVDADDQSRIEQLADLGPMRRVVSDHFARLSQEQRDAVQLRVIEELPYPDVAERLRVSEDAARARVSRGLRQLAGSLDDTPLAEGAVSND
jgi:RNA polymerase sigma factor (sigma-70 family)